MKRILIIAVLFLVCIAGICCIWLTYEPAHCPLCESIKCHAPCLVNLSTGEVSELALYQPHPTLVGEVVPVQDSSTYSFFSAAGVQGTLTTLPYVINLRLPVQKRPSLLTEFCKSCRKLLSEQLCSFAIVDLYTPDKPVVYAIYDGASYELRGYQIQVQQDFEDTSLNLTVTGSLDKESSTDDFD